MSRSDPTTFDEVVQLIGPDAALRMSLRFRGLRIYILKSYADAHPMVAAIGREKADLLSEYMSGVHFTVPDTPGLQAEVFRLADAGVLTAHEIAAQLCISQRRVERWLADRRNGTQRRNQLDLFSNQAA